MAPIMDDMDLQFWHLSDSYSFSTGGGDSLEIQCSVWGEIWFGKWIHNPQLGRDHTVPTLTEADKDDLAKWLDAYPNMGVYIAVNGELESLNAGSEANGGHDIQERMPPDLTPEGESFTAPDWEPSGQYVYINDRNAAVPYHKQIETSDQAWNHNCYNIPIRLSAASLDDLPSAPATQCQGRKPKLGVEGSGRGRVVISGNNVLSVFDSELGRMDFSATTACRLR